MRRFLVRLPVVTTALACGLGVSFARAETLAEVVAYAYDTNPGFQSQRASLRALDETYVQARANFGPSVSATAGATGYSETLGGQHLYANTDSETLTLNQPLYAGGRLHSQLSQAEAQVLAGRETFRGSEMQLLQQVVGAYVGVRRDEALLKVSEDTVVALEKESSDTEALAGGGQLTKTDVAEAKARLAQARAALDSARATLGVSRSQFIAVVGRAPGTLEAPSVLTNLPDTITQAFESAESNSPQLAAAKYTEQKSRARVAEVKAGRLPVVSAQVGLQHTPYLPYTSQPYNYAAVAGISLSQPIFTSGQISSQIRQAKEQNNSDRLAIDDARNRVTLAVSTSWQQLSTARDQLTHLQEQVEQDLASFSGNSKEHKASLRSTIDVLNAELELTSAERSVIQARADEYQSEVALLAAIGVLDVRLLSPAATPYDPAGNFRSVEHKGETPLEWPVRALDGLGGIRVGKPASASLADVKPQAGPLPPAPQPEAPLPSILTTLQQAQPEVR